MLVTVQAAGAKAPLYFIHGLSGAMPLGRFLAQSLGSDQPLYAINANSVDSHEFNVKDMARTYAQEILDSHRSGLLCIAGMCAGGLAALEVARELKTRGLRVGPVILADPPPVPQGLIPQNQRVNHRDPLVVEQLYRRVHGQLLDHASQTFNDMPFSIDDPQQIHASTLAGVDALVAFCRHVPEVFPGETAVILSPRRASGFFHPQTHWGRLLPGRKMAYVLPYDHTELFRSGRHDFARVLRIILDGAMSFGASAESTAANDLRSEYAYELD